MTAKKTAHPAPKHRHHASVPEADSAPVSRFREAYDRFMPAMRALDEGALMIVNIDIPSACTTAIGALPEITAFREQIAEALPKTDLQIVDSLEGYALATLHAHALWLAAAAPPGDLVKLNDEALALRDQLYGDATTLSRHGLLDAGRLAQLKVAIGYKNVALDLISLAALLREAWPRIQGKSAVELSALDTAETLADRIITAVGARACQ